MIQLDTIFTGDCLQVLKTLPDESVHCCVTSPPYYALRDYGMDGQIGRETTPKEYVSRLTDVLCGSRRVLRSDAHSGSHLRYLCGKGIR
jgi:DNA modification methylase